MRTFSYEPSCPPTIPEGVTLREYRRARGRQVSRRRRVRVRLGRVSRSVWR